MLDDFLTQQQVDELSFYNLYEVDCDDGTIGDIIYAVDKEAKQLCLDIASLTAVPPTYGAQ